MIIISSDRPLMLKSEVLTTIKPQFIVDLEETAVKNLSVMD